MNSDPLALRADAARNRTAILAAAERLFAEPGFDVPLATLAAEAGVGRTTPHRNFATREHIAFALSSRSASRSSAPPPRPAPASTRSSTACSTASSATAASRPMPSASGCSSSARRRSRCCLAVDRAVAGGALRPDFSEADLRMVYEMAVGALLTVRHPRRSPREGRPVVPRLPGHRPRPGIAAALTPASRSPKMRIALTGGSGRVGRAVTEAALARGHAVVSIDRTIPPEPERLPGARATSPPTPPTTTRSAPSSPAATP